MSAEKTIFEKNDFKNICFYYFLPFYNYVKKNEIGEKINQFNGVNNLLYNFSNSKDDKLYTKRKYIYSN